MSVGGSARSYETGFPQLSTVSACFTSSRTASVTSPAQWSLPLSPRQIQIAFPS